MRPTGSIQILGYDLSDEGIGRSVNEDASLSSAELGLFAVADGAGGAGRGDIASKLALKALENYIGTSVRRTLELGDKDILGNSRQARRLSSAVHHAHRLILETIQKNPEREGMATTVLAGLFNSTNHELHLAWVGDSRAYRLRHGQLEQLTQDHTIATDILERRPDLDDQVLENLPRNSVVRALGMAQELRVSISTIAVQHGDRFLFCTDGLSHYLEESLLNELMNRQDDLSNIASELMASAIHAGSHDNITVLTLEAEEIIVGDEVPTARYHEIPLEHPSSTHVDMEKWPESREASGIHSTEAQELDALSGRYQNDPMSADTSPHSMVEHIPELGAEHLGFDPPPISSSSLNDLDPSGEVPTSEDDWQPESNPPIDPLACLDPFQQVELPASQASVEQALSAYAAQDSEKLKAKQATNERESNNELSAGDSLMSQPEHPDSPQPSSSLPKKYSR